MMVSLVALIISQSISLSATPLGLSNLTASAVVDNDQSIYYTGMLSDTSYDVVILKDGVKIHEFSLLGLPIIDSIRGHGRYFSVRDRWVAPRIGWTTSAYIFNSKESSGYTTGGGLPDEKAAMAYRSVLFDGRRLAFDSAGIIVMRSNQKRAAVPAGFDFSASSMSDSSYVPTIATSPIGAAFAATLISDDGQIRPFVWTSTDAKPVRLSVPSEYKAASAEAVNSHGEVAGTLQDESGAIACLWSDGSVLALPKFRTDIGDYWIPVFLTDDGLVLGVVMEDYLMPPDGRLWVSDGQTTMWLDQAIDGGEFEYADRANIGSNGTDILVRLRARRDSARGSGWYRLQRNRVLGRAPLIRSG